MSEENKKVIKFNKFHYIFVLILCILIGYFFSFIFSTKTPSRVEQQKNIITGIAKTECKTKVEEQSKNMVIEKLEITPIPVDFTTYPRAKTYFTVITKSVASGVNFSGHFTFAEWGCGTDCFGYAIIDTVTGEFVSYEPVNSNYHLRNISAYNNIFILDPVNKGQQRKYYRLVDNNDGKSYIELFCTEVAQEDMYFFSE